MTVYEDIICPWCGCCCDDIEVEVEDDEITDIKNGCRLSRTKFMSHDEDRIESPQIRKDGELAEVSYEEAIEKSAEILSNAEYPLIYGLSSASVEAQSRAVELAEEAGAILDNTASVCHSPTIFAVQSSGAQECTLGEVKNRADLVIFWGSNPMSAHPRHPTRYSIMAKGLFTEGGKADREMINVDVRETNTAMMSDQFIKVEPGKDYELLAAVRAAVKGYDVGDVAGVSSETIEELAEKMKEADYGVIYYGLGLTMSSGSHNNIIATMELVKDLNEHTKFTVNPMRGHFNVAGANKVMSWLTGYPVAVNFFRGYPVYGPGEFTTTDVLARKECDAALILASDPVAHLPAEASKHLSDIPTIVIDPKLTGTTYLSNVVLPVAMAGIETEGTTYRMDGIPLRLKKVIDSDYKPDEDILEEIIEGVKK